MTSAAAESISIAAVETSVKDAVASGRIGPPVNVRLHWQAGPDASGVQRAMTEALRLTGSILELSDPTVRNRSIESGRLLHALVRDERGRSGLISVAAGTPATLALTVYGNHGVIRLDETPCEQDG